MHLLHLVLGLSGGERGASHRNKMPFLFRRRKFNRCSDLSVERDVSGPPKLENKIVFMSVINTISFCVTLKQLTRDVLWNMNVLIRDPDLIFSCSSFDYNNQCCAKNVKSWIEDLYETKKINEKYVLCYIVIGGVSGSALLFIFAGFWVGYRSKYRNNLMHPIFSVGAVAHIINCLFFTLGTTLRRSSESDICNVGTSSLSFQLTTEYRVAVNCLKQVLSCQDLDEHFKVWFLFSLGWTFVGLLLLVFLYKYSRPYFRSLCQLFCCSQNIRSRRQLFPPPTTKPWRSTTHFH